MSVQNDIQKIYIGLLGRAADQDGLDYWTNEIESGALTLEQLRANIVNEQPEYEANFGDSTRAQVVAQLYNNLFNREPDEDGLEYWVNGGGSSVNIDQLVLALTDGAAAADQLVLDNRVEVANYYTTEAGESYDQDAAQGAIADVDGTQDSVDQAKSDVDSGSTASGETFTLTDSADDLSGTAGNDSFKSVLDGTTASNTTLSASDEIDGGQGSDTLSITLQGGATANVPAADVTNVENIAVRNVSAGATAVDGSAMVGAEQFINDRSTADVSFDNIGSADVTIQGNGVVTHTATNIDVGATAVTDAFTLNIKDGVKGGAIDVADTDADWTEATVNSTGAANTVGAVNLSGNGAGNAGTHTITTLNVNAASNLTTGQLTGFAADASVVISGAAEEVTLGLGAVAANVDSVDASGLTGGVTLTLDGEADTQFVGGQGNDVVTTGVAYAAGDTASIDAGEGAEDRLVVAAAAHIDEDAGAKYSGFEQVQTDGQNIDLDHLSGIDTIVAQGVVQLDNVTSEQAANVIIDGNSTATVNVKDAGTVGQIDTVSVTVDDSLEATNTITLTTPTLTSVEQLEIDAIDNATVTGLDNATSINSVTLTGEGDHNFTVGAVDLAANTTIDASAATGDVVVDASAAQAGGTSTGLAITGGAGDDTITGTDKADALAGGAGDDEFVIIDAGFVAGESISGGAGDDDSITVNDQTGDAIDFTLGTLSGIEEITVAGNATDDVTLQQGTGVVRLVGHADATANAAALTLEQADTAFEAAAEAAAEDVDVAGEWFFSVEDGANDAALTYFDEELGAAQTITLVGTANANANDSAAVTGGDIVVDIA